MKICDRCYRQHGKSVAAGIPITIGPETFDLCVSCSEVIRHVINNKELDKNQNKVQHNDVGRLSDNSNLLKALNEAENNAESNPKPKKRGRPPKSGRPPKK